MLFCIFTLVSAVPGNAKVYCISSSDDLLLRLYDAAVSEEDDVIKITQGTYYGNFVYSSSNLSDLTIEGGYLSVAAPCDQRVVDPAATVLDGSDTTRTLTMVSSAINGSANFSVDALTMQNGKESYAGGLYAKTEDGAITVTRSIIRNNYLAGAYLASDGDITVTDTTISGNDSGGGMDIHSISSYAQSTIQLVRNSFTGNRSSLNGGGLYLSAANSTVTINNNVFSGNIADSGRGGAVMLSARDVLIEDNAINGNEGGGLVLMPGGWSSIQSSVTVRNNRITNNTDGPGIRTWESSTPDSFHVYVAIINNVIAGNAAGHYSLGGGISLIGSRPAQQTYIVNNTITGNISPGNGGGLNIGMAKDDHHLSIYANIFWDNSAVGLGDDLYIDNDANKNSIYSPLRILNNDFDRSTAACYISEPSYVLRLDASNLDNVDPAFVNSGLGDFHLLTGSPCINSGNNAAPGLTSVDLDQNPRIMSGVVDMGPYESFGPAYPAALFGAAPISGQTPLTVFFTDQSLGDITSWSWSFGDGTMSSEQDPKHSYTQGGQYTVSLTVSGPEGSTTKVHEDMIIVNLTSPTADAGPDRAIAIGDVTLDGSGSNDDDGNIMSYKWLLTHREEPAYSLTATGKTPAITGLHIGFYDVELEVTDNDGLVGTDTMILAVMEPCAGENDQQLGLPEAIHILKILTEH